MPLIHIDTDSYFNFRHQTLSRIGMKAIKNVSFRMTGILRFSTTTKRYNPLYRFQWLYLDLTFISKNALLNLVNRTIAWWSASWRKFQWLVNATPGTSLATQKTMINFLCVEGSAINASQSNWKDTMMKLDIASIAKTTALWFISSQPYRENHFQPINWNETFFLIQKNLLECYQII